MKGDAGWGSGPGGIRVESDAERGSGTVLVLVLVILCGFLITVTLGLGTAILQRHRAGAAADLAALAAVDAGTGPTDGAPGDESAIGPASGSDDAGSDLLGGCAEARRVALANDARLDDCRWLSDGSVLVRVLMRRSAGRLFGLLDLQADATSRAGPGQMTPS
jgi:hypothetical protein